MNRWTRVSACFVILAAARLVVQSAETADAPVARQTAARNAQRMADARVLQRSLEVLRSGEQRETRLLSVGGRYPLVADETIREAEGRAGAGQVLRYRAMIADHLVVQLRPGQTRADLDALCRLRSCPILRELPVPGFFLVAVSQPGLGGLTTTSAALRDERSIIQSADVDNLVWLDSLPNDEFISKLYSLNNTGQDEGTPGADIDATEAWDFTTGNTNILVAVIDSGIDLDHPDLRDNLWQNPGETGRDALGADKRSNGKDDDSNGFIDDYCGWDFFNNDNTPDDDHGHGSHCAGTIGAVGNNGIGIAGICWKVKLLPVKVFGPQGAGPESAISEAVLYAAARGARVLSNSYGSQVPNPTGGEAVRFAEKEGCLFVAAAGNSSQNNDATPCYPANYTNANVLSVAASNNRDILTSFSNYGKTTVHLAAPGDSIYSCLTNGLYGKMSGTSMAAPHVSGAAALLWSAFPDASCQQIKQALLAGVDTRQDFSGNVISGGRLNVKKALMQLAVDRQRAPAGRATGKKTEQPALPRDTGLDELLSDPAQRPR